MLYSKSSLIDPFLNFCSAKEGINTNQITVCPAAASMKRTKTYHLMFLLQRFICHPFDESTEYEMNFFCQMQFRYTMGEGMPLTILQLDGDQIISDEIILKWRNIFNKTIKDRTPPVWRNATQAMEFFWPHSPIAFSQHDHERGNPSYQNTV